MPRNPSPAQSEAVRANGRRSRGPQGEAKRRSCQNSYKTGLRSRTLALEYEHVECEKRSQFWYNYYQTQSPAAFHLANECAQATMLADRCHQYRQAEIDRQTAAARKDWMRRREERVTGLAQQVHTNPAAAIADLLTFGFGVAWLGTCFQELIQEAQSRGHLSEESIQWAVRLYGVNPTPQKIRGDVLAYTITINNLGCNPGVGPKLIEHWLEPARRPVVLRDKPREELMGDDADKCREFLLAELEFELERLRSEEERLEREVDGPSLEEVLKLASILTEEAAKRVARSHGESRATFHRALATLYRTLDRDEAEGPPEQASNDELEPAAELVAEAEEAGDVTEAATEAPGDVVPVPSALAEQGAEVLPNDPEKSSDAPAQPLEITTTSVD